MRLFLLSQQHQLPLLRMASRILPFYRQASPLLHACHPLHHFTLFPLSPYQVAALGLVLAPQRPPGPRLEYALHQQAIVALADIGLILEVCLGVHQQPIAETYRQLKLPVLHQILHLLGLGQIPSEVGLEVEPGVIGGLPALCRPPLFHFLPLELALGRVVGHHDLAVQDGVVENHLLIVLHALP